MSARRRLRAELVGWVVLPLALAGCAAPQPFVWASSLPPEKPLRLDGAPVAPGDTLAVAVRGHDTLGGTHVVGLDGNIVVPLAGAVNVAGSDPEAIARELEKRLGVVIETPQVAVVLMQRRLEVSVLGEVTRPGKYAVTNRDGVAAALALAGGLTEFADEESIYLVRPGAPRIRFRLRELVGGGDSVPSIALRDGDLLVVE
jgi:polysaccharide export outer membrane protein